MSSCSNTPSQRKPFEQLKEKKIADSSHLTGHCLCAGQEQDGVVEGRFSSELEKDQPRVSGALKNLLSGSWNYWSWRRTSIP